MDVWVQLLRNTAIVPFLVMAFLVAFFFIWKKGKEEHFDPYTLGDAVVVGTFSGLLGARLGFVFLHLDAFGIEVWRWISVLEYPGYLGTVGLIFVFLGVGLVARRQKVDGWKLLDVVAIGIAAALFFLTVGTFIQGSGFGKTTTWMTGMQFPGVFDKRHPVQLYVLPLYLVQFLLLYALEKRYRFFDWYRGVQRVAQPGIVFVSFLGIFSLIQIAMLFFQESIWLVYGLPVELFVYLLMLLFAGWLVLQRSRRLPSWHLPRWQRKR